MNATYDVWTDPDLRELVRNEPELAVIADALAQAETPAMDTARRRRLPRSPRVVAVAAAITAAVAVALVAPWDRGNGDLSGEALAAVGPQPVLHVVVDLPATGQLVNLQTGTAQPVVQQEEIWYDADQSLERDLVRLGGAITDDTLQTPQGGYTPGGIVYDCPWIAAHPIPATKAGVSCNASGDNGTVPHVVPPPKPTLEPGLAGFVDGYQQALASGQATDGGSGEIDGQSVDWLIFQTSSGEEKVALDQTTHKPVLLEGGNGPSLTIDSIGTVPYDATDFARPAADEIPAQPSYFQAGDGPAVALDGAAIAAAMPGAVWAGPSLAGLPLTEAEQQPLTATFAHNAEPPQTGTGIQLDYGQPTSSQPGFFTAPSSQPRVQISESPSATLGFPNMWSFIHDSYPSPDTLYEPSSNPFRTIQVGYIVSNGVYVTIWASSTDLLFQTARALQPAAP